jgi:hypothetical protein
MELVWVLKCIEIEQIHQNLRSRVFNFARQFGEREVDKLRVVANIT